MTVKEVSARQQERRAVVINIARQSFQQFGLHGASMAVIAKAAELSVGQIYRIFDSKEEILEAVVSEIVSERVTQMLQENHDLSKKAQLLAINPVSEQQRCDDALLMEIHAESLRNPRYQAILYHADLRMKAESSEMIRRHHPELSDEQIADGSELLATIVEGSAFRRLYPRSEEQKQRLLTWYQYLFELFYSQKGPSV